jgi:hypothetical protein
VLVIFGITTSGELPVAILASTVYIKTPLPQYWLLVPRTGLRQLNDKHL